ncbi:TetR/AcrR family transcriptional regulator [Variovorax sp. 770b2]|uniref:TetR/AcrR family transcriptional regulator n=1 Tax=Variovorax sp. 770b2 TaxID=1566271 RepID=UPI0008F44DEB|nr:hypothetical protein [Variovorax sp. 770b2]SFQ40581.1 transcriptional regulator, TetR family [Variovorax sp. 770b2]
MARRRTDGEFMQELSDLLLEEGIAQLGVGEIASRLQCSRRRLYDIAESKQGLLFAVARRHFEEGLTRGERAAAAEDDPARVIVAHAMAGVETAVKLSTAFLRDLEATEEGSELFDAYQRKRAEGGRAILEAGIEKGYYNAHNAMVATEIGLGAAMRLRRAEFLAEAGLTFEEAMAEAYDLMHNGLLVRAREPRAKQAARPSQGSSPSEHAPSASESARGKKRRTAPMKPVNQLKTST